MNDQDVFNSIFTQLPALVHALPCEWNLQYHAFQEQLRICGTDPDNLGCKEARDRGMFLCRKKPGVVHFMAQSYKVDNEDVFNYYLDFYNAMKNLPEFLLRYEDGEGAGSCRAP